MNSMAVVQHDKLAPTSVDMVLKRHHGQEQGIMWKYYDIIDIQELPGTLCQLVTSTSKQKWSTENSLRTLIAGIKCVTRHYCRMAGAEIASACVKFLTPCSGVWFYPPGFITSLRATS